MTGVTPRPLRYGSSACSGPGRTGVINFPVALAVDVSSSSERPVRARASDAGR